MNYLIEKFKPLLFRIIGNFKIEETEDLSSVFGICLQDRIPDNSITIECLDGNNSISKCIAEDDLKMGNLVIFSESGKVKRYERKNTRLFKRK